MSSAYIPQALRSLVARQSGGRCGYCRSSELITGTPLDIDHILSTALGGRRTRAAVRDRRFPVFGDLDRAFRDVLPSVSAARGD